jgi:arylformamidase
MSVQSPAWYDEQYNNRARVPECVLSMQRWGQWSEQVRATVPAQLDLRYGPGPKETLDVFESPRSRAPIVVFIHGGYWRSLDKSDHSLVAPAIQQAGALPVIVNYDLAPSVGVSEICRQMLRALEWVWRHGAEHGGDPQRIHVVGHSAGGHLAAMMLCAQWKRHAADLPADLVKSAMSISGVHELDSVRHAAFVQADLKLSPQEAVQCSPAWMPAPRRGQILCVVGGIESPEFLRQNALLRQHWGPKRVPVVEELAGEHHFSIVDQFRQPNSRVVQLLHRLLAS